MTEETQNTSEISSNGRDATGRWLPGFSPNPSGENGLRGRARWEKIVEYYRANCTVEELRKMATDMTLLGKMKIEYAEVIVHLASTISGKDRRGEREALYDRLWGCPTQVVQELPSDRPTQKAIDEMTPEEAQREYERISKG